MTDSDEDDYEHTPDFGRQPEDGQESGDGPRKRGLPEEQTGGSGIQLNNPKKSRGETISKVISFSFLTLVFTN